MKKTNRKNLWNTLSWLLVLLVVLLAVALVGVRLIGLRPFAVLSGSMEPAYKVGSLVYVRKTDPEDLKVGDVITFMQSEDTVVTHRIVEIVPDEEDPSVLRFRTKGDGNDTEDGSPVHYRNVLGRVVFSLPGLGYVAGYISGSPGRYVAMGVAAVLLVLVFLPDVLFQELKKKGRHERRLGE